MKAAEQARIHPIRTPEGISLPFEVASAADRLFAFTIDFILIHGTIALTYLFIAIMPISLGGAGWALAMLMSFFLRNFYFIFFELRWGGSTPGKRKLGIRVISRDGGPLTAEAVFARNLTRDIEIFLPLAALLQPRLLLPGLPGWGAVIGTVWLLVFALLPLLGRDRLRCGDIAAGTLVVRMPRETLLPDLADAPPRYATEAAPADEYVFTDEQLDLYGIHELQVLEDLLRKQETFDQGELLDLVCEKIKTKIGWPRALWKTRSYEFLKAFYKAQRARLEHKMLFGVRQEKKKE